MGLREIPAAVADARDELSRASGAVVQAGEATTRAMVALAVVALAALALSTVAVLLSGVCRAA